MRPPTLSDPLSLRVAPESTCLPTRSTSRRDACLASTPTSTTRTPTPMRPTRAGEKARGARRPSVLSDDFSTIGTSFRSALHEQLLLRSSLRSSLSLKPSLSLTPYHVSQYLRASLVIVHVLRRTLRRAGPRCLKQHLGEDGNRRSVDRACGLLRDHGRHWQQGEEARVTYRAFTRPGLCSKCYLRPLLLTP